MCAHGDLLVPGAGASARCRASGESYTRGGNVLEVYGLSCRAQQELESKHLSGNVVRDGVSSPRDSSAALGMTATGLGDASTPLDMTDS